MTPTPLAGRTALVTGSTSGLGAGIAAELAAAGAHVVVTGRNRARGADLTGRIESAGGLATFVPVDFTAGVPAVRELAAMATEAVGGRLDILVNNVATLVQPAPTAEVTEDEIMSTFGVSVVAPFLLTGLLAPPMAQRGDGAVVNIGSISGILGSPGSALYGATKAAVHSLTKSWAAEYGPRCAGQRRAGPHRHRTQCRVRRRHRTGPAETALAADEHRCRNRRRRGVPGRAPVRQHPRRRPVR